MLAARKTLEDEGRWSAESNDDWGKLEINDEKRAWMDAAKADFSRCFFLLKGDECAKKTAGEQQEDDYDVSGLPVELVALDCTEIDFRGFKFPGSASFGGATFTRDAHFESTTFTGAAWFGGATFKADARFDSAIFMGDTSFDSATFQNSTSFQGGEFQTGADFSGIKVERAFNMTGAKFSRVPAFNQSDFKQAPDLDDVYFPLPSFWRASFKKQTGFSVNKLERRDERIQWRTHVLALIAQYRALRRMAVQGADYEREQMAFKGELRAKRWTVDKWYGLTVWLGWFYDWVADCGRSIWQPLDVWAKLILVFAVFYRWQAADEAVKKCAATDSPIVQALYLSLKNALVLFGGTRDARVNQAYVCLYDGTSELPKNPASVTFMETLVQLPLSAALIFLLLLAVRNRYKIK